MTTTSTRTQLRGICPACFAQQALNGDALVQHGYRRPQHWHANVGTCSGTGHAHFGTEAGRDVTARIAKSLRDGADRDASDANDPTAPVFETRRERRGFETFLTTVRVDEPTPVQRARWSETLRQRAAQARIQAAEYEALVTNWEPREPVAVEVEKKSAPLVHWRSPRFWRGSGKACAGSMMGAQKSYGTTELADVTCPKCRARAERVSANA